MILYHGSYCEIESIKMDECLPHTDFGRGFYLTPIREHAIGRANKKAVEKGSAPVLNIYDFDESAVLGLRVKKFDGNSREWAEFVWKNRECADYKHDFDIVIGPIADDNLRKQFSRIKAGIISLEELAGSLTFKNDNIQYAFCTDKSLECLKKK